MKNPKNNRIVSIVVTVVVAVAVWLLMAYLLRIFWMNPFLNLKYDWGYTLFDWHNTWLGCVNAWNDWFLGSSVLINAGYITSAAILVIATLTNLSVTPFLALLLTSILAVAVYAMAVFLHDRGCRWWLAILLGLVYALAPMMWIRVVIGFIYYLIAAAIAPLLLTLWTRSINTKQLIAAWFMVPLLAAVLSAQPQFIVMVGIICLLDIIFSSDASVRKRGILMILFTVGSLIVVHAPWLAMLFRDGLANVSATNSVGGSLATIQAIPHSALRTLFGADHHITYNLIDQLLTTKLYIVASVGLVVLALFAPVGCRSNKTVRVMSVALAIAWLMGLGPQVPTSTVFVWIYQHLPFNNIFREVYHWSWLITFSLVTLAGVSLEYLARWWKGILSFALVMVVLVGWMIPWLRGDFYAYITPLQLPSGYQEIALSGKPADTTTSRSLFLPSLGFLVFRNDTTPGAVNSDIYAFSTNRSSLPFASSLLDFPTPAQDIRNATVMALRSNSSDVFTGYLQATAVSTIYDRPTLKSKFTELFTLPTHRLVQVKDWQDIQYAPLLSRVASISSMKKYDGVTQYNVDQPQPLISYAKQQYLAGDDWTLLGSHGRDAVFFASDGNQDQVLPYIGDPNDLLAVRLKKYNVVPYSVGDKVVPNDGWVRKNAVWWWDDALTNIKGPYIFTTQNQPVTTTISTTAQNYTVMAKYWVSRYAQSLQVVVADQQWTINTAAEGLGGWRWQTLGSFNGLNGKTDLHIRGTGETGVAQLLVVPTNALKTVNPTPTPEPNIAAVSPLQFTKIAPSQYQLQLSNDQLATLIVRIGYDNGWQLRTDSGIIHPTLVSGYAMAFAVPPTHSAATLEFIPQRSYHWLTVLALAYIVVLVSGAVVSTVNARAKAGR